MDFISISVAVVLIAILVAWYALLEYEERRQRKELKRPKRLPEIDGRRAIRERRQDRGGSVESRPFGRTNGSRPPPETPPRMRRVFQGLMSGYGLAAASVLLAYLLVALGNLLFPFPPLIFFGAAVAFAFTYGGRAAGLFALVLATLLSDFFFVKPTFVFSLNWQVFRLSVFYLLGGLLSVYISKRLSWPTRAH